MGAKVLYDDGAHKFLWIRWGGDEEGELVQTNQFLIIDGDEAMLLDPGGVFVLPEVIGEVATYVDLEKVKHIFYTHQDPDVCSGVAVWLENTPAKVYISKLWVRFLPHFGVVDSSRIVPIEDSGGETKVGRSKVRFIPAHFLHSTGNFNLFDETSGILFSGDIGASVYPPGQMPLEVKDFDEHVKHMEGFHRRYMASKKACRLWVKRVRELKPKMIVPQHGSIFTGENVDKFLSWLENLDCGVDILEKL